MTRIIIIIVQTSAGLGGAFLVLGAMFLFFFSQDGDHVQNTINTITHDRTYCFPSVNAFENFFMVLKNERVFNGEKLLEKRKNELKNAYGIIELNEGTDVKVHEEEVSRVSGQLTAIFNRVTPVNEPTKSCFVSSKFLEMGFYQWIKWKWTKNEVKKNYPAVSIKKELVKTNTPESVIVVPGCEEGWVTFDIPYGWYVETPWNVKFKTVEFHNSETGEWENQNNLNGSSYDSGRMCVTNESYKNNRANLSWRKYN